MGVAPIPIGASEPKVRPGDPIVLAGYGTTETGTIGELRFLVESVIEVNDASIRVDGFGVTGACTGDSGGPILTRSSGGGVVVLGLLSTGSASCRDEDRFVRVAAARDWIESVTGPYDAVELGCEGIGMEGRCFHGDAIWCEDGSLGAEACAETGRRCGWDAAALGFRCVHPVSDPCLGVDGVGSCRAGNAMTCAAGLPLTETCGPCGACLVDGRTGKPYCASPAF